MGLRQFSLDDGLIERDYGRAEGTTAVERLAEFGSATALPGAEPLDRVEERAVDALLRIATEVAPHGGALVVTHSAVIRQLLRYVAPRSPIAVEPIENPSITALERDIDGRWRVGSSPCSKMRLASLHD